jgi:hypothetical protein
MIYGYDSATLNEFGLKQMREISLDLWPDDLRKLADFLSSMADELEEAESPSWHRHAPDELRQTIGCDVVVCNGKCQPPEL